MGRFGLGLERRLPVKFATAAGQPTILNIHRITNG